MKKLMKWIPAILGLTVVVGFGATNVQAEETENEKIFTGVYINDMAVGGLTEEEADTQAKEYANELLQEKIVFTMGEKSVEIAPEDIGLEWSNPSVAKDAYDVGRCGNLIKRYKEQKDLESDTVNLRIEFTADDELLLKFLNEQPELLNVEPMDNGLKRENGAFVFVKGQDGYTMDVEGSYTHLTEYFVTTYDKENLTTELAADIELARGSEEELALVKDVLGTFKTHYLGSVSGRNQNVENGVKKINGHLVFPDETFSVYEVTSPYTLSNGYGIGYAFQDGTSIESVGGGICQVSTTLYNAVIRAELEVVQRAEHSMIVTYVEPAEDAAIAGTYKDLKFKNNTGHPIYIEGYCKGGYAYFTIYGVETRSANRTIKFVSEVTSKTEFPMEFVESSEAIGYVMMEQEGHTGYSANLWKVVYENGKEVSREKLNSSKYRMTTEIYKVGMSSKYPEAVAAMREAMAKASAAKDIEIVKAAAAYWNDAAVAARQQASTPTPTPTPPAGGNDGGTGSEGGAGGETGGETGGGESTP